VTGEGEGKEISQGGVPMGRTYLKKVNMGQNELFRIEHPTLPATIRGTDYRANFLLRNKTHSNMPFKVKKDLSFEFRRNN